MDNTKAYLCSLCKTVYAYVTDDSWSPEQARKEYETNFPDYKWEDREALCDDCYDLVMRGTTK